MLADELWLRRELGRAYFHKLTSRLQTVMYRQREIKCAIVQSRVVVSPSTRSWFL